MGQRYLDLPALLAACQAGQGDIVVLEGETYDKDAALYGRWFGHMGTQLTFQPQNGWSKVVDAVTYLRQNLPTRHAFGIIDRDFASEIDLQRQATQKPNDHIFRTRLYTVENYLLDASGWLALLNVLFNHSLPPGWQTIAEVQAQIEIAYRQCTDLAAYNLTVNQEVARQTVPGVLNPEYLTHPNALTRPSLVTDLRSWGQQRTAPTPLDQTYAQNCAMIRGLSPSEWPIWITGKVVLTVFRSSLPEQVRRIPSDMLRNLYLTQWPAPPADLAALIDRIVQRQGHP